jgi:hypothetical protein
VSHPRLNGCQINSGAKMHGRERRSKLMQKPIPAMRSFGTVSAAGVAQAAVQSGAPGYAFALTQEIVDDSAIAGCENQLMLCRCRGLVVAQAVVEAVGNRNLTLFPILWNKSQLRFCLSHERRDCRNRCRAMSHAAPHLPESRSSRKIQRAPASRKARHASLSVTPAGLTSPSSPTISIPSARFLRT